MKVVVFGATGMVGQGVLLECLAASDVDSVVAVVRGTTGVKNPRLQEILRPDLFQLADIEDRLAPFDACFFCLGVSSFGMAEATYRHLTYDLTLSIATILARRNPRMTFVYVSGAGTASKEDGRQMWARVKGETENALGRLPFKAVYFFRPGLIVPVKGVGTKTTWYRWVYGALTPFLLLMQKLKLYRFLTTEGLGNAMLQVARRDASIREVVEADQLKVIARGSGAV